MVLKVSYLVGQQEGVWHELVVKGKEPLQSAYYYTKNIFLSKVVHEWISVENAFAHFDYVKIVVSEGHSVPQQRAIAWLRGLSVAIFTNYVLQCV